MVRLAGKINFHRAHVFRAPLVDRPDGVDPDHVAGPGVEEHLGAGYSGRANTVDDDPDIRQLLPYDLESIEQRREDDDGRPVLVVVKNWDVEDIFQALLNRKATGRRNVQ